MNGLSRVTAVFCLFLTLGFALGASAIAAEKAATTQGTAILMDIHGPIGPATSDYVHRGLATAHAEGASLVILRLDTPGGLDTAMRDIVRDVIGSALPVVGFVAPGGARAASAGTYILYASHVAVMAPGTNLGAATPIRIGFPGLPTGPSDDSPKEPAKENDAKPDEEKSDRSKAVPAPRDPLERKVVNDAAAYLRSLAQMRGRNVEWAEEAVRAGVSLSAEEARSKGVIDFIAADVEALLVKLDGREVSVGDARQTLRTTQLNVIELKPDWRSEFLAILTNPNIAYLLMIIGFYGLVLEFYNPGSIVPGVVGAISLLLALYAFQSLPINYAGMALIILGAALLIAEAFAPSFGALGLGGVVSLVIGSVMLIDTEVPGFGISWQLIAAMAATSVLFFTVVMAMLIKARKRPVVSGASALIGAPGSVIRWADGGGEVRVMGEEWSAKGAPDQSVGQRVRVTRVDGLMLTVESEKEGEI